MRVTPLPALLPALLPLLLGAPPPRWADLALHYSQHKGVQHATYLTCDTSTSITLAAKLNQHSIRVSAWDLTGSRPFILDRFLVQWGVSVGVILQDCYISADILMQASRSTLFGASHKWLIFLNDTNDTLATLRDRFGHLNLSVDAEICVAFNEGSSYRLFDVFNFGKIQGNELEVTDLGTWDPENGLDIYLKGFKYYNRRDFHNLTFRTVTAVADSFADFSEEKVADSRFTPGVPLITKVAVMVLTLLKDPFNFRFNYTVLHRWVGSPDRNATPAITSVLFWKEQDLACTTTRMFPAWLQWVDYFLPPLSQLQTRIYYLIPERGVGDYENRFLTPLSAGAWWVALGAAAACVLVLAAAASVERRAQPAQYALFSVVAASFQQFYEDGDVKTLATQGSRATLLVIGLTSLLLYNYYTSSVVSWLLNAAAPTIESIDALIDSDLELIFEDVGYARQWVYNPGPFYLRGYTNQQEERLRDKKVNISKRSVPPMQNIEDGVALIRKGGYAFHAEPYTVSQVIARTFDERELCELGSLQMIKPGNVFVLTQKRSPYKKFFSWSLLRAAEGGLVAAVRGRTRGAVPACAGSRPRALTLGQAAPAFLALAAAAAASATLLLLEILTHRVQANRK